MKEHFTHFVCCLLAAAILLTGLPVCVSADETHIEVVSNTAPLREGPGKDYNTVTKLAKGDCLRVTGTIENKHGNLWYAVQYGDNTHYLYAEHVKTHEHKYLNVTDTFAVCKCGSYKYSESGQVQHMSYAAGDLLNNDALKVLGALEAAKAAVAAGGSAAAAALSSTVPYVAVAVVCGITVYILLSASGTQITNIAKIENAGDIDKILKKTSAGKPYYKTAIVPGTGMLLFWDTKPMTLKEAGHFINDLRTKAVSTLTASFGELNGPLINVWCKDETLAENLCKQVVSMGNTCVRYGSGSADRIKSGYECDEVVNRTNNGVTYDHYHVYHKLNTAYFTKVCDVHILFGYPKDVNWQKYAKTYM